MKSHMKIISLLLVLNCFYISCGEPVLNVLTHCCDLGKSRAESSQPCEAPSNLFNRIARNQQAVCKTTAAICCLARYRRLMCDNGIEAARQSQLCISISGTTGGEFFKDCCEACKLGIAVRNSNDISSCDFNTEFSFDFPWQDAYGECCLRANYTAKNLTLNPVGNVTVTTPSSLNTITTIPQYQRPTTKSSNFLPRDAAANKISMVNATAAPLSSPTLATNLKNVHCHYQPNQCDHLCVDTPTGHLCQCYTGYSLQPDSRTCVSTSARCLYNSPCEQLCTDTGDAIICNCKLGYELQHDRRTCADIDECALGDDECDLDTHNCVNIPGSYDCVGRAARGIDEEESALGSDSFDIPHNCDVGFNYNAASYQCEDIDECILGVDNCDTRTHFCTNQIGSYTCNLRQSTSQCPPGYEFNQTSSSCVDVNECERGLDACERTREFCFNFQGTYECQRKTQNTCPAGYKYSKSGNSCEDLNECQLNSHSCLSSQRCDNTIGSFTCIRLTGCGTGYTLNAHSNQCEDDDECELGNHNCGLLYQCRNTHGSFRCDRKSCPYGHRLGLDGTCQMSTCDTGMKPDANGNCIDVNECETPNICRSYERCINTAGSYKCQSLVNCGPGYELDPQGASCIDVDECTRGKHECRGGQQCINRPGGYLCQCPAGYLLNYLRECEDIDECSRYGKVCAHNSECHNTPGSYQCNCKEGFQHGDNDRTCNDVDECQQYPNICHHKCVNTWGSYQCVCNPGFTLGEDKRSCTDVDECSLYKGPGSLCIGTCINEPGSFSCACPQGYSLGDDKRTCQDIDECIQPETCKGENEVCLNTRGGFKCNQIQCPPEYIKDTTHKNRCKRESSVCRQGDLECIKQPMSYSYNYLTFVSDLPIPPVGYINLFTMRGPPFQDIGADFNLEMPFSRSYLGVNASSLDYFQLRRTGYNQGIISIVRPIIGPQDIELKLSMNLYRGSVFGGVAVAKIFIYVTEHEY